MSRIATGTLVPSNDADQRRPVMPINGRDINPLYVGNRNCAVIEKSFGNEHLWRIDGRVVG